MGHLMIGIFIFLAGFMSILEVIGLIRTDIKWGIPLLFTCLGLALIISEFLEIRKKKAIDS